MEINLHTAQDVTVVEVVGDIDGKSAPQVEQQVIPLAKADGKVLLNLTGVNYMSSAGLRVLLAAHRRISSSGAQMVLVGLSEELRDTMSMTGFLHFFKCFDKLDEGLAAF